MYIVFRRLFFLCFLIFLSCNKKIDLLFPVASFTFSPIVPVTGEPVTFSASSSKDENGSIISYTWNFDDESFGSGEIITHSFESEGTFQIKLTVIDDDNQSATKLMEITVNSSLVLVDVFQLSISSPSGLSLNYDGESLWTVSDKPGGGIYKISLTETTMESLPYSGVDLEGVVVSQQDSTLWIVEESLGKMIQLSSSGDELQRISIPGSTEGSGGLEGITFNPNTNHFYLLKEKDPGVLIILDSLYNLKNYIRVYFANDFSGIFYDQINNKLWIISDQDSKVFLCDLLGNVIKSFSVDVSKAEGIAVDIEKNRIYIVSDLEEKLYVYKLLDFR